MIQPNTRAFMLNPVGRGFHKHLKGSWVDGKPLPDTKKPDKT